MDTTFWLVQNPDSPLFPDILWSRPELKSGAGKIAIIGGSSHGFGVLGMAYSASKNAGVGSIRILMPDAVRKVVQGLLPEVDFAPNTPSGSFSKLSLDSFLQHATWSDMTMLAGDFGRNSETSVVLEAFLQKFSGPVCVNQDRVDFFLENPKIIVDRLETMIVATLPQLQKIFIHTPTLSAITTSMNNQQLADALHDYTNTHTVIILVNHNDILFVAHDGKVSSTKNIKGLNLTELAAKAGVFWAQNPNKPFEAITTSLITD